MSVRALHGDCRLILPTLPADSFDCIVTSPPYWGLRDYGVEGQIGLEPTLDGYIETMREVGAALWRVLKPEGVFWLNLGDCYNAARNGGHPRGKAQWKPEQKKYQGRSGANVAALKPKDLCLVPHRVAMALQADGWWLRGDQVWAKSNGMPESTRDRPVRAHEYVFLLTKSEKYYFGYDDVKMPPVPGSVVRLAQAMRANLDGGDKGFVISGDGYHPPGQTPHNGARKTDKKRRYSRRHAGFNDRWDAMEKAKQQSDGAALRSVWWLSPGGYSGAHFATMPEELAALLILAGCPIGGHVLDPFGGSGTTGLVADRLGRNATLIELNPAYCDMGAARIKDDGPLFAEII